MPEFPFAFDAEAVSPLGAKQILHVRGYTFAEFQANLAEAGAQFPQLLTTGAPAPAASAAQPAKPRILDNAGNPPCPRHARPMRQSKFGGWYCTAQEPDGSYCDEQIRPAKKGRAS